MRPILYLFGPDEVKKNARNPEKAKIYFMQVILDPGSIKRKIMEKNGK